MDETLWHKYTAVIPRKLITGQWSALSGQLWRRRNANGKWEYKQDPETEDEAERRAW